MVDSKKMKEIFAKLDLNIRLVPKGLISIAVNEKLLADKVVRHVVTTFPDVLVFDISKDSFYDIVINQSKIDTECRRLIILKMNGEENTIKLVLDQANLMRDIMVKTNSIYIFVQPYYAELYILRNLPNLYDYFILKQSLINTYDYFFDAILASNDLEYSKEQYNIRKNHYIYRYSYTDNDIRSKNTWSYQNLTKNIEYYSNVMKNNDVINEFLNRRVNPTIAELLSIIENKNDGDDSYRTELVETCIMTAQMLRFQKMYNESIEYYAKANRYIVAFGFSNQYSEIVIMGIASLYYSIGDYERAESCYHFLITKTLDIYSDHKDIDIIAYLYINKSACEIQSRNHFEAKKAIEQAEEYACTISGYRYRIHFFIVYNKLLNCMDLAEENLIAECEKAKSWLSNFELFPKEKGLWYSLYAWIQAIYAGNLDMALEYALEGLRIKREFFLENDMSIAESHYEISLIYYFMGKLEYAKRCYEKCINILKNHEVSPKKKRLVEILKNIITEEL